jgi:arylsulfatase A-like enzyme
LITVDTVRADHLDLYGYELKTSPNLVRLAADGIVFERAWSQASWTLPSLTSMHTSLYPSQHGARLKTTRSAAGS